MARTRAAHRRLLARIAEGDFRPASGGRELRLSCPECSDGDPKAHLYINRGTGKFICHRCRFRGQLWQWDDRDVVWRGDPERAPEDVSTYDLDGEGRAYLLARGVPLVLAHYYGFRILYDRHDNKRLWLPIVMDEGRLRLWTARALQPGVRPKYLSSGRRVRALFNWSSLHPLAPIPELHLCEGPFSALAAGKWAVATFGKMLSAPQVRLLALLRPQRVYVAYDGDAPLATGLAAAMVRGIAEDVRLVPLVGKEDPDDLGYAAYQERCRQAEPATTEAILRRMLGE